MMRKNSIVAGAVLSAAALTLTACTGSGGGAPNADGADGQGDVTGEIAISWWGGDSRNQKTNAVIDMFEQIIRDVFEQIQQ